MAVTDNLQLIEVADNQTQKETTINNALNKVDNATQGQFTLTLTANAQTLTAAQFTSKAEFVVPGTLAATGTLTLPALKRIFVVDNRASSEDVVVKNPTGGTATVVAGISAILRNTGTEVYEFTNITGVGVTSVLGNTGAINIGQLVSGGVAPLASPTFTGAVDGDGAATFTVPTVALADDSTNAASTAFVQNELDGLSIKPAANWATAAPLPTNTFAPVGGVGDFIVATANGALTVDGGTVLLNDLVLVANEVATEANGLYQQTVLGDVSTPFELTRVTSLDEPTEFPGAIIPVLAGGVANGSTLWICLTPPASVGVDPAIFVAITGATWSAGAVTTLGTTLAINSGTIDLAPIATHTVLANITGGSAKPISNTVSAILDAAIASTQGDILYRSGAAWVALAPGTNGQMLTSGGAAANVSWTTPASPGSGTVTSVDVAGGSTGLSTSGGPITSSGTITLAGTLAVASGGTGLTAGTSGGILGYTATGVLASSGLLPAHGVMLGGGAGATPTAISLLGAANQVLTSNGAGVDPSFRSLAYTLGSFNSGTLTASQVMLFHKFATAVTFPANFGASSTGGSSQAGSLTDATGSSAILISQCPAASDPTVGGNFTNVGTITIGAAGHAGTFTSTGGTAVAIAVGDFMKVLAPSSPDATLANVTTTLVGNRG